MSESRLSAEELSRRIGLPASTIKKIRRNEEANPTISTLWPIAKYFNLTISQFVGEDKPVNKNQLSDFSSHLTKLPIISWQEAPHWRSIHGQVYPMIASDHYFNEHAYALMVEEDNLENLAKGTVLLIDPSLNVEHRDYVVVLKIGQKLPTLKQVLFDEDRGYLKPLQHGYHLLPFTPEHKVLGVVVEYKKKLRLSGRT